MYYITNYSYGVLLSSLDLDIPNYAKKRFFEEYKISGLEKFNKKNLSNNQIKLLVISDIISKDKNAIKDKMYFYRNISNEEHKNNKIPAYHIDKNCMALNSDYINPETGEMIPNSGVRELPESIIKLIHKNINNFNRTLELFQNKFPELIDNLNTYLNNKFLFLKLFIDKENIFDKYKNRTEQNRTEQNRTEQNRTEQNKIIP